MLSIALQGLRGRKGPFAGAFVALAVAAALVMACGTLLQAGLRSQSPVERYSGAPLVVAGDQTARIGVGTQNEDKVSLYERVRVNASLVERVAAVPGVRRAIADVSVPAEIAGPHGQIEGPTGHPIAIHPWSAAAITPYALASGRAPLGPREVVVDSDLAHRGRLVTGAQLRLASAGPAVSMTVVGVVRPPVRIAEQGAIFASEKTIQQLTDRSRQVDAIAVLPQPGIQVDALERRVARVIAAPAHVVTGPARGDVEHLENVEARDSVVAIGGTFGGLALLIAMFVVASTIGLSVLQREREVALLRAVAATPKQVRRMIRWETIVVGLAASLVGVFPGAVLAAALGHAMSARGIAPEHMEVTFGAVPAIVAVASSVLTSFVAVVGAGRRAARVRPTLALQESGGSGTLIGPVRLAIGTVFVAAAIGLLVAASAANDPSSAADMASGTSFALVLAAAALGPVIVRVLAALASVFIGRGRRVSAFLAVSNMRTAAARFGSAMTPLVLTVAISSTLLFTATTREHGTGKQERERVIADLVVASDGIGVPRSAVEAIRRTPGVATAVSTAQTNLGPGLGSNYTAVQAVAVDPAGVDRVLNLDVRYGSLSHLRPGLIALSKAQAATAHASVGERVRVMLGDGTRMPARVAAIYTRSLGFGDVVLPTAMARGHLTSPLSASVLVRVAHGQSAAGVAARLRALAHDYPTIVVGDRSDHAARADKNRDVDNWLFRILAGIIFVFTSISVVNTLLMIGLHRRRELALLQLVGATRRQVIRMARWEGFLTVALGLSIGGGIALITLIPTSSILTGSAVPHAPPALIAAVLGSAAFVGLAATHLSTRLALRPRPVDGIGLSD